MVYSWPMRFNKHEGKFGPGSQIVLVWQMPCFFVAGGFVDSIVILIFSIQNKGLYEYNCFL
jgi:hypothetical protein